jgi:hypothetical protein
VADDVSRGVAVNDLAGRWRNGPEFLRLPEADWPQESTSTSAAKEVENSEDVSKEYRSKVAVNVVMKAQDAICYKEFSS